MKKMTRFREQVTDKLDKAKRQAQDKFRGEKKPLTKDSGTRALEEEVIGIEKCYQALTKRIPESHPYDDDREKIQKKVPLFNLGTKLMMVAASLNADSPFSAAFLKTGRMQLDLGQLQIMHNTTVYNQVFEKITHALDFDFNGVTQARKDLSTAQTELEKSRRSPKASADLASMQATVDTKESKLQEALLGVLEKDKELIDPLIQLVQSQLDYFLAAAELLERSLPTLMDVQRTAGERKVIGSPLPAEGIDPLLLMCCRTINRDGANVEGIFRLAGSKGKIRKLRAGFSNGTVNLVDAEGYGYDIHAVAGLIKIYLRELPSPVLTSELYKDWIEAAKQPDHDNRLYAIQNLLQQIPQNHVRTLKFLCRFLSGIAQNGDETKMYASNLGIVIGPNLLWPENQDDPCFAVDSSVQGSLCEMLITYVDWFFPKEGDNDQIPDPLATLVPDWPHNNSGPPIRRYTSANGAVKAVPPTKPEAPNKPVPPKPDVVKSVKAPSKPEAPTKPSVLSTSRQPSLAKPALGNKPPIKPEAPGNKPTKPEPPSKPGITRSNRGSMEFKDPAKSKSAVKPPLQPQRPAPPAKPLPPSKARKPSFVKSVTEDESTTDLYSGDSDDDDDSDVFESEEPVMAPPRRKYSGQIE